MTKDKKPRHPDLWQARPVEETIAVYADWAETYDADISERGYHTPARIATALRQQVQPDTPILDFGCGTGFSGQMLLAAGFQTFDGTDVTAQMLARAVDRGIYRKTWLSQPGSLSFGRGAYPVIIAAGVISLGAAPAETLGALVAKLDSGGILAFSFNDPTLADPAYADALGQEIGAGRAEVISREHGPHLDDMDMGADVILLRRR